MGKAKYYRFQHRKSRLDIISLVL